MDRSRNKLVGV